MFSDVNGASQFKALNDVATLDLYRKNPFRVLGLQTNVTLKAAKKQVQKLTMDMELSNDSSQQGVILPMYPPPEAGEIRNAASRLEEPDQRLVDELFWFWPMSQDEAPEDDELLSAMKSGNYGDAKMIWRTLANDESVGDIAQHNLAVLSHALALDIEFLHSQGAGLNEAQTRQLEQYWQEAYAAWRPCIENGQLWKRLAIRVAQIDDPRLNRSAVEQIRAGIQETLLSINTRLATKAAEDGDTAGLGLHVRLVSESGFSESAVDSTLRKAIEPVREKLNVICTTAEKKSDENIGQTEQTIESMFDQAKKPLAVIDSIFKPGHPVRETAHDQVAQKALLCLIGYVNKTNNYDGMIRLTKVALDIAEGADARKSITDNIEMAEKNREFGMCFFCKKNPSADEADKEVKLYGNVRHVPVGYNRVQVQWNTSTIKVPRCKECKRAHQMSGLYMIGGIIFAGIPVGLITLAASAGNGCCCIIAGLPAGLVAGYLLTVFVNSRAGRKGESEYSEFPPIKEKLSQGFKYGEKPPEN